MCQIRSKQCWNPLFFFTRNSNICSDLDFLACRADSHNNDKLQPTSSVSTIIIDPFIDIPTYCTRIELFTRM